MMCNGNLSRRKRFREQTLDSLEDDKSWNNAIGSRRFELQHTCSARHILQDFVSLVCQPDGQTCQTFPPLEQRAES